MLLSAALIVRDEAPVLADCLSSIRDVVDEIVVVDTGSSDESPRIAHSYGATVLHHAWADDFAEARNVALDAVQGEWILYIDADERLVEGDREAVERLLTGVREIAFLVLLRPRRGWTAYREHRLWRNDPRIRFVGQIHEKVAPAIHRLSVIEGRPIGASQLLLDHVGYEGDQSHKHRRNLPLLRAQLSREPFNLFNRHHLATVLRGLGEEEEADEVLAGAVEVARARPHDRVGVLAFNDLVLLRMERDEPFEELLQEARRLYPQNKSLWWVEATVLQRADRYEEAIAAYDRLLAADQTAVVTDGPAYDARIFGEFAHEARGTCLFRLERYEEAAESFAAAARLAPDNLEYSSKATVARGRAARARAPG